MTRRFALLAALALAVPSASASGQSLFNAAGMGVPSSPADARARSLGGVGVGLRGAALLGSDPAAAADFLFPSVVMTAQPAWVDFGRSDTGETGTFQGTRFPSLGIAYPTVKGVVATLAFESVLDQRYHASWPSTVPFGDTPVEVRDEFTSDGGVSQIRLGVARRLNPNLSVGLSASRYTGSVTRQLVRFFGAGVDTTAVEPFQAGGLWRYSGVGLTGGAALSVGSWGHLAGSVTWSTALDAEATGDTEGDSRSYDLPLEARVGATAVLAPGLLMHASMSTADWSAVDNDLQGSRSVGRVWSAGFGVELSRARLLGRTAPLRLGYHRADLPFALGTGTPTETVWSGGLGLNMSQVGELVRAGVDLGVEKGSRSDSVLSEDFWRATLTVRVSGF